MGYDYNTRTAYEKKCLKRWEKENQKQLGKLSREQLALRKEIDNLGRNHVEQSNVIEQFIKSQKMEERLSLFMEKNCKALVELYVPKELLGDYYAIIDEYPAFPYVTNLYRPTVRTADLKQHVWRAFRLLYTYKVFGTYKVSVKDYITDQMEPESLDFKRNDTFWRDLHMIQFDDILAARINAGDEEVIRAIEDAILSENNTVIVTVDMIRAVVKSRESRLHELLAQLLVAARLQEGIRQAICENADAGRVESFLVLLQTIEREKLLRFSAVKRAVATWTGICNVEAMERITDKVFAGVCEAVRDRAAALRMLATDDSVQIITGLWALGFYDTKDAVEQMLRMVQEGTRPQRLAISYYNLSLHDDGLAGSVARSIIVSYADDPEMVAAFLPTYMSNLEDWMEYACHDASGKRVYGLGVEDIVYDAIPVQAFFGDEGEARTHYQILNRMADGMKKRKQVFDPCIFPWYSVTLEKGDLVKRMALIAYTLQDVKLIDEVCTRLSDITGGGYYASQRKDFIRLLLHTPANDFQRRMLVSYVADKESDARTVAYRLLMKLKLAGEDYLALEEMLKYKNQDIRKYALDLLQKQEETGLFNSIRRLLQADQEAMRMAGLDLLKQRYEAKPEEKEVCKQLVLQELPDETILSDKEKLLYEEITAHSSVGDILHQEGYGLYDPKCTYTPSVTPDKGMAKDVKAYFSIPSARLDKLFLQIREFVIRHGNMEYTGVDGDTKLLVNGLFLQTYDGRLPLEQRYPFPELWQEVYDTIIQTPQVFWNLYACLLNGYNDSEIKDIKRYQKAESELFGSCDSAYHMPPNEYSGDGRRHYNLYYTILNIIKSMQQLVFPKELAVKACLYAVALPEEQKWYEKQPSRYYVLTRGENKSAFIKSEKFCELPLKEMQRGEGDELFRETFPILYLMDREYDFKKNDATPLYSSVDNPNLLCIYDYVKAYELGMIEKDMVYKAVFELLGLKSCVDALDDALREDVRYLVLQKLKDYMPVDMEKRTLDTTSAFYKLCREFYTSIEEVILNVELKRGDSPTIFSGAVSKITIIQGIPRLIEILTALGTDTLDRQTYYYFSDAEGRKQCLCHLLKVCVPKTGEDVAQFRKALAGSSISKDRLIEVAMYAPQWLDMIESYLECEGFKSGCYYFMAHMNERFDDKKKAMIAKYSPLSPEELQDGCFDVNWFFEVQQKLDDKLFTKLYKSAKYIADGSKHTRARKYADAAMGKVERDVIEAQIREKRNKDLLMSYGLIPIQDEADKLHRYEFLQSFLKESKQFGAQRRQSEAKCVEVALKNMASALGYDDDIRLTLDMETALVTANREYFEGVQVGEYLLKIVVSVQGKAELVLCKQDKRMKSVPTALKKEERYLALKEFVTKLRAQYSRCITMFERAMEERDTYALSELQKLCENPVTKSMLTNLVWGVEERFGMLEAFADCTPDTRLYIAHPCDLYRAGVLADYQRVFFLRQQESGVKQPFKQVFREFYLKLPEEQASSDSRMFAGYQIQPAKTLAALKTRRWVADYENGLQKIYYKDNIIATIYALADWFSPADTEAPTLEYVSFYDRKSFGAMKLSQVPDAIYSEVMRDVDLAVSVAHVGGVDPETSHSTMEMRKVICAFNVELFGLGNVTFEGTHARIEGTHAQYSVHLGSGVIHKLGGPMINILPVHSQARGKLFLPFIDDDPKTAEIMSKILLLAEDYKIKDPYIMEQIVK
ncbi:MAG: DUF4132 domain-containing protein [Lachnospiraceae bacterium]|nr:DUF4132 domain-containing protein [Lachnospiraceae bacterium]